LEKKYKKAEQTFIRAVNIYKEPEQTMHRDMANVLNNLGLIADERKIYGVAEQFYQYSIAVTEHLLGANYPDLVFPLYNLAYLYQRLGKRAQAEPFYQRALEIGEEHLGTEHSLILKVRDSYASFLTQKPLESRKPGIWPRVFRRKSS